MKTHLIFALCAAAAAAQTPTSIKAVNPVCTSNCTSEPTKQTASSAVNANHTTSSVAQVGNSSASNASGVKIDPVTQQSQSAKLQQTGNQSAQANGNNSAGGSANARTGDNTNTVRSSGGKSSSISTATGGSGGFGGSAEGGNASVGATTASNGAQSLDTGHNTSVTEVKSTFIPNMMNPVAPVALAGSNIVEIPLPCGPLQRVVRSDVHGVMAGLFRTKGFVNGTTDDLEPYEGSEPYRRIPLDDGRKGWREFGHQPILLTAVVGVAGGRSIGGGGTTAGQASGQLGLGGTSSVQQIVVKIILRECEYGTVVVEEAKVIQTIGIDRTPTDEFPEVARPIHNFSYQNYIPDLAPLATPVKPSVHHKKRKVPACVPKEK